jgi:ABC-2 type transport system permease protein
VTAALRYEWVRISTVRSTRICLVLAFVLSAAFGWLASAPHESFDETGQPVGPSTVDWWGAFVGPLTITAVLASVVAAQSLGQEYRFGLIRLTLTAFPRRGQALVAKSVGVVGACVVLTTLAVAGSWLAVTVRGHPTPPQDLASPGSPVLLALGLVFVTLWGLSAFAIAGITRQTALGIAVPIVSGLIVEQLLGALLRGRADWLITILPWSTAGRWLQQPSVDTGDGSTPELSLPVGWAALGVFAVWVVVFLVVETVSFLRRDA